jgi:hypothetical protein
MARRKGRERKESKYLHLDMPTTFQFCKKNSHIIKYKTFKVLDSSLFIPYRKLVVCP